MAPVQAFRELLSLGLNREVVGSRTAMPCTCGPGRALPAIRTATVAAPVPWHLKVNYAAATLDGGPLSVRGALYAASAPDPGSRATNPVLWPYQSPARRHARSDAPYLLLPVLIRLVAKPILERGL